MMLLLGIVATIVTTVAGAAWLLTTIARGARAASRPHARKRRPSPRPCAGRRQSPARPHARLHTQKGVTRWMIQWTKRKVN